MKINRIDETTVVITGLTFGELKQIYDQSLNMYICNAIRGFLLGTGEYDYVAQPSSVVVVEGIINGLVSLLPEDLKAVASFYEFHPYFSLTVALNALGVTHPEIVAYWKALFGYDADMELPIDYRVKLINLLAERIPNATMPDIEVQVD